MSDKDSLFGSPPPSPPARGRSPSLALPEPSAWRIDDMQASSQNVGTIALPGSHEQRSEHPVFIDPALPSVRPPVLSLRPPAQSARAPTNTARRPRSVSRLPSPAPINPQTDRTLRDLAGLVSHFEPVARAAPSRPPPIAIGSASRSSHPPEHPLPGSAENPIEIDAAPGPADAVNSALVALAGTVASALKLPATPREVPSLSQPTVNSVLQFIKHDPKLIPVLQATYEYLGSIPNQSQPQQPRSFSHVNTNQPDLPPKKKRRRKYEGPQVPAGAGHWNVPYPFAPGQAPSGYPSQWQLDRGRRVLGELLGLFERAFAKTRGDLPQKERPVKRRRMHDPESVTESARSDFEGTAVGASDEGSVPPVGVEDSWQDHQRMNDWLSSVPALSASSSIVESTTSSMPSPSPSPTDPALPSSNSLQDFMAILGPDFFGGQISAPVDSGLDFKSPVFDFEGAFDDVGFEQDSASTWSAMLQPGPNSQSINDITAFPMGVLTGSEQLSQPSQPSPLSHEFVIDPALMAISQTQLTEPHSTSQVTPVEQALPKDLDLLATASSLLMSLMEPSEQAGPSKQPACHTEGDLGDVNADARSLSLHTVPTTSASSSQAARTESPVPSVMSSSASNLSLSQRRAMSLAKAREHRARLVEEIERVKIERWETVIEGGVLKNLQKASVLGS